MVLTRVRIFRQAPAAIACCCLGWLPAQAQPKPVDAPAFAFDWAKRGDRVFVGPGLWANRLQDWQVAGGRLECVEAPGPRPLRTVHCTTHRVANAMQSLELDCHTGWIGDAPEPATGSATGFLIGAGAADLDWRAATLVHQSKGEGGGWFVGVNADGPFIRANFDSPRYADARQGLFQVQEIPWSDLRLEVRVLPDRDERMRITVGVTDAEGATIGTVSRGDIDPASLLGALAVVCDPGVKNSGADRTFFRTVAGRGPALGEDMTRLIGPIVSTQFTVSRGVLKLTAQLMPIGVSDDRSAQLLLEPVSAGPARREVATDVIPGNTATFVVPEFDSTTAWRYRVRYALDGETHTYEGEIPAEPTADTFTVAAFTGNHNVRRGFGRPNFPWSASAIWYPHLDIVRAVAHHDPDLLFFSGDQVYEGASPTPADQSGGRTTQLDYLYKWYLWCVAFRDLTRRLPTVCEPDDHDVYHGNIWGAGGKATEGLGMAGQDSGGYKHEPAFVKMVERTQCSHLPDPYDPRPIQRGIGVYFTALQWGGVSFAIIEDRKFKSAPKVLLPDAKCRNGFFREPTFDPSSEADVEGALLLGPRQLDFIDAWAADWSAGTWMKVALSQTIFANVATLPKKADGDQVLPRTPLGAPGEYQVGWKLAADADSNGWPQSGRNRALRALRRGFALHIAGDQHLASTVHYGVDASRDSGVAICVPSIANFYPRRWWPEVEEPKPGANLGDFVDGFGNQVHVMAVANPVRVEREPRALHSGMPGYGIVKLQRKTRKIELANWPRYADPSKPEAKPYPGWPIVIDQAELYGRASSYFLPTLEISGMSDPVVQVIREGTAEVLYTLRIRGQRHRPKVFVDGKYTVRVGEPGTTRMREISGLTAKRDGQAGTLPVTVPN